MPNVASTLEKALNELRAERTRLDRQITAVEGALSSLGRGVGRRAARAVKKTTKRASRTMSAAQKRAVSKRMKAYWAKRKKAVAK